MGKKALYSPKLQIIFYTKSILISFLKKTSITVVQGLPAFQFQQCCVCLVIFLAWVLIYLTEAHCHRKTWRCVQLPHGPTQSFEPNQWDQRDFCPQNNLWHNFSQFCFYPERSNSVLLLCV